MRALPAPEDYAPDISKELDIDGGELPSLP